MEQSANREMRITRVLKTPIDLVWQVWTNPEHIAVWWGPNGFTNTIHTMDLQEDEEWKLTMHGGRMEQTIQTGVFSGKLFH